MIDSSDCEIYGPAEHCIDKENIPYPVAKVLSGLNGAGHDAYLVGGSVRDLLLNRVPRDFDVATSATPTQIVKTFKNSRAIGRRFRLVHVKIKSEIVEVATFRRNPVSVSNVNRRGIIFRDNDFGNMKEDVVRRDFTINALYLDLKALSVIDYVGGMRDLRANILRVIGNPKIRFREDPVRILRAVRFANTFGLRLVGVSNVQIRNYGLQLQHVSSSRLFGEIGKLLLRGSAVGSFGLLRRFGLLQHLFPLTDSVLRSKKRELTERFIGAALLNTDRRVANDGSVTVAFLFAVLLWQAMLKERESLRKSGYNKDSSMVIAVESTLSKQLEKIAIPRHVTNIVREIWSLQNTFTSPNVRRAERILRHPRLRAGYNFFALRAKSGERLTEPISWWRDFFRDSMASRKLPFPGSESYDL